MTPLSSFDRLAPKPRDLVEAYLREVERAVRPAGSESAREIVDDVRRHLLDELAETSSAADVRALLDTMGSPGNYADGLKPDTATPEDERLEVRRFLGMPYDFRPPTARRIAERWWDPLDRRIIVPRVFGIGWTINFAAAAVRLGLMEPDAEDVPFSTVPRAAFFAAAAVPVATTLAMTAWAALAWSALPDPIPVHWNIAGQTDGFGSASSAIAWLLAIAWLPTLWAVWSLFTRRSGARKAAAVGAATLFAGLACGIWLLTVSSALWSFERWWLPPVVILAPFVATFAVLTALGRSGRHAEIARDIAAPGAGRRNP